MQPAAEAGNMPADRRDASVTRAKHAMSATTTWCICIHHMARSEAYEHSGPRQAQIADMSQLCGRYDNAVVNLDCSLFMTHSHGGHFFCTV